MAEDMIERADVILRFLNPEDEDVRLLARDMCEAEYGGDLLETSWKVNETIYMRRARVAFASLMKRAQGENTP